MKKASLEALLMISNVYDKKKLGEFIKDIRASPSSEIDAVLNQIAEHRVQTLSAFAELLSQQTENKRAATGTVNEVQYLLLTASKLKVPDAAKKLSEQLKRFGYNEVFELAANKANFIKWLQAVCENMPRDKVMEAALRAGKTV